MSTEFSFIILTFNEAIHLPRLLNSIAALDAETFVLDSGSTDQTLQICEAHQICTAYHPFVNHPQQWDQALNTFPIKTPWIIGLDADQVVSPELCIQLLAFKNKDHLQLDGIYFNRKNIYKGKWIKYGGYYPKYLLKMFRYQVGYSDLNENMDHKFQVPGQTTIWKNGHLVEENLKENNFKFWIEKHNRYSDLMATEEIERMHHQRIQSIKPNLFGSPNERNAWMKRLWWQLPLYIRPFLYFIYRMIVQRGILEGKTGIFFHIMQGLWFRLVVDIKIEEKLEEIKIKKRHTIHHLSIKKHKPLKFLVIFPVLFFIFYYFNIAIIGVSTPGGYYNEYIAQHLNHINQWRHFNISTTASLLRMLGYDVYTDQFRLHIKDGGGFILVHSCLGYGILSLFSAFILAFPRPLSQKLVFLALGILGFQFLNLTRLLLIALYWKQLTLRYHLNAHAIFNYTIYVVFVGAIYLWINQKEKKGSHH
ncbi:glycosyltransferase [Pedobacter sp.]|uniref:glycosyltransferase n=1 Tax=Pedobacter sp. TaxID=1411316 RepID=UPI003D7FBDBF